MIGTRPWPPPPPTAADMRTAASLTLTVPAHPEADPAWMEGFLQAWQQIADDLREPQVLSGLGALLYRLSQAHGCSTAPDLSMSPPDHRGHVERVTSYIPRLLTGKLGIADVAADDWAPLAAAFAKSILAYGPNTRYDLAECLENPAWPPWDQQDILLQWHGVGPS